MSKHTKGPWVATKFNPVTGEIDDCYLYVEPGIAVIERKVKGLDQNDTANANLIAAAPELLGALEGLLEAYSRPDERICCDGGHCGCMGATAYQLAERDARAAIAKAKGESQ